MTTPATTKESAALAWLFVPVATVPAGWLDRAVPMALIPLLPDELTEALPQSAGQEPPLPKEVQRANLIRLVARGLTKQEIARLVAVSPRTLDRRLRELRDELGTKTLTELAAFLARRGFGD